MKKRLFNNVITPNALRVTHHALRITVSLLLAAFLVGCGSGPGSPGSQGSEDTGVLLEATVTPTYGGSNTYSVDVYQQTCDAGPPPVYEVFSDHTATVAISARLLNPNTAFTPGTLYIDKYTVTFYRSTDSVGAPPIEKDTRYTTIIITPPSGTATSTTSSTVILVDLIRKNQYYSDVFNNRYTYKSAYLNNYTAVYTFYGKNQYGTEFSFTAQVDFQIGSFDNCG